MIFIDSKIKPNPLESGYWVDLKENPYGGIVKYFDGAVEEWVYMDEPIFKNSPAANITNKHIEIIEGNSDTGNVLISLQKQIDNIDEAKADKSEVTTDVELAETKAEIQESLNKIAADVVTTQESLKIKIEEGDTKNATAIQEVDNARGAEIKALREAVEKGYDDSELRNAIADKTSYTYVEQRIQAVTGVAPTVLDTLEELAAALGDDPNFAGTVTEMIAEKTSREDVIEIIKDSLSSGQGLVEIDPTVPNWAKQPLKPVYTASEVGALSASTVIPSKTTDLTNDAGFVTQDTVSAMIAANKPLTADQYAKINRLDSFTVYNITEDTVNLPLEYGTIIINVPESINILHVHFSAIPKDGSKYRLYINPINGVTVIFYTLNNEQLHSSKIGNATRFDITAIDLTDYPMSTESGLVVTSEGGSTIVVNILDGYIIDYIGSSNNRITWYEGS